jgi:predicted nucleic-acid-binding Zn-ribbon protein
MNNDRTNRGQGSFVECSVCAAKSGSPTLCDSCLANRSTISRLESMLKKRSGSGGIVSVEPGIFKPKGYVNLHHCSNCGLTEAYGAWSGMDSGKPCPHCGNRNIGTRSGKWISNGFLKKGEWVFA